MPSQREDGGDRAIHNCHPGHCRKCHPDCNGHSEEADAKVSHCLVTGPRPAPGSGRFGKIATNDTTWRKCGHLPKAVKMWHGGHGLSAYR